MNAWLESSLAAIMAALAMPKVGLPAVFAWCVVSATLLPLGSEAAVFAYVKVKPHMFVWAIVVATIGNTLGGMINYWLAYGAKQALSKRSISQGKHTSKALEWFEKLGPKALFFSFLPGIGDPLTAVAGWLKLPWLPCLLWQTLGKLLRYVVMTWALLIVPDALWMAIFAPIKALF